MKARAAIISLVVSLGFLSAPAAASGPPSHPTTVSLYGASGIQTDFYFIGQVDSPKAGCVGGRTVNIFAKFSDGSTRWLDSDTTSAHGLFIGGGDVTDSTGAIFKVKRRTIGSKRHPQICRSALLTD